MTTPTSLLTALSTSLRQDADSFFGNPDKQALWWELSHLADRLDGLAKRPEYLPNRKKLAVVVNFPVDAINS